MALIEADSHVIRLEMADKEQSGKATKGKYDRYLQAYETWWNANQSQTVRSDTSRVAIPALPITVAKVVLFLKHESTREKKVCVHQFTCDPLSILMAPPLSLSGNGTPRESMKAQLWDHPISRESSQPLNTIGLTINISMHTSLRHLCLCVLTAESRSLRRLLSTMSQVVLIKHTSSKQQAALQVMFACL